MTDIERLINTIAAEYDVPGWAARAIAWGESSHNPSSIATEPDGRQSVGLFQIHDIHGLSMEWRLVPENNIRWAMENSVGPSYRDAMGGGLTDREQILAHIWRYGQRCAVWAIAPAVERAMAYLERYDRENPEEEPDEESSMRDQVVERLEDIVKSTTIAIDDIMVHWPVGPPPAPTKTINLVLVTYQSEPAESDYYLALTTVEERLNNWLRPQGLGLCRVQVSVVRLPNAPTDYSLMKIVRAVEDELGTGVLDGDNALYIFSQDEDMELVLYGTIGGDWFDGPQFPGVSFFMIQGLYALAHNNTHSTAKAKGEKWTRDKALGAIAHELGHNLSGLPCAQAPHGSTCVMKYWAGGMSKVYEATGYVYTPDPPPFSPGGERESLINSGFMKRL